MIEVGRNNIIIRDVDLKSDVFKKVSNYFSLYDKVLHKYTFSIFSIIGNDLYFPASVTLEKLQSFFPKKQVNINYKNTAKAKNIEINLKHQPRNDLQKNALSFLSKIKNDKTQRSRFLSLATGMGKTYITINLISQLKKCPLIIVDTVDLAEQWKREFLNHTDVLDNEILILSGQDSIDKAINNPNYKVYIAIHRTIGNMLTIDQNSVNKLMYKLGIGIRVFDESHVEFNNICNINALSNVQYTLFLTATPNRSNFNDDHLYGKVFKSIPYFNGSSENYHTVVTYKINTSPNVSEKLNIRTKYGFSQSKWASFILNTAYETFFEEIAKIFEKLKLVERNKKIAIMLPTIELIKKMKPELEDLTGIEVGMFIGEVNKNKRSNELSKKIVLTNDKIFGKAIDDEELEILINCVPVSSLVKTEQIMGRLRNHIDKGRSAILIDVYDAGFDECIRQFKIRKRFYKKKAKKIIELN